MKKIYSVLLLILALSSCGNIDNSLHKDMKGDINRFELEDSPVALDARNDDQDGSQVEGKKTTGVLDFKKYEGPLSEGVKMINNYILMGKLRSINLDFVEIIKYYGEGRGVIYFKDNKSYYYLCSEWPACEGTVAIHNIGEGELKIIDKFSYEIGGKSYKNKMKQIAEGEDRMRKENSKLINDFGNGFTFMQGKGLNYHRTIDKNILYYNDKTIWTEENLNITLGNIEFFEGSIVKFSVFDKNEPSFPVRTLIYDKSKDRVYRLPYSFISTLKKGKSGLFFIVSGQNGYSNLRLLTDKKVDLSIYIGKPDVGNETEIIRDYELLLDRKIKVFYDEGDNGIKKEKIIQLK